MFPVAKERVVGWLGLIFISALLTIAGCSCSSAGSNKSRGAGILCLGDSQTYSTGYGVRIDQYWPAQVQGLANSGYALDLINEGHSNWTTEDLLGIALQRIQTFAPKIVILYAGVNDKGHSLSSAKTQSGIQSVIDTALSNGVSYVLVVNTNYLNYSTRGDNASTNTYYSNYQTLRTFQLAAANYGISRYGASKVGYCDLFEYQKSLILAGTWKQGRWQDSQVADNNEHMNAAAQKATASFIWNTLKGVPGLLDAFKTP